MRYSFIRLACLAAAALSFGACASTRTFVPRFVEGDLLAREAPLVELRAATTDPTSRYETMRAPAQALLSAYQRRAERQQTFLDIGSGITFAGAAGAFEGGLTPDTRTAWAVAAFTPTVISQFNAYEPTRELFHGGALALQLITLRYDRILRNAHLVAHHARRLPCAPYRAAAARAAGWTNPSWDADRAIRLEAERLLAACESLDTRVADLEFVAEYARSMEAHLAANYAADVLRLDHALVGQDRELRYTPSETLGALISSPLRAADMLLTGTSVKAAIDDIATLNAFRGLNQSLANVALPPLPGDTPTLAPLSPLLRQRMTLATTDPEVVALLRELENRAVELTRREAEFAFRLRSARELLQAAHSDYLTFTYDTSTRTATVSLGPRPAGSTATATTGTTPSGA